MLISIILYTSTIH